MTFSLQLSAAAENDMEQATTWYEHSHPGLGSDFTHSVEDTLVRILHHPEAYPLTHGPYRRALVRRFSYVVWFKIKQEDKIVVSAVVHTSRSPGIWQKRLH